MLMLVAHVLRIVWPLQRGASADQERAATAEDDGSNGQSADELELCRATTSSPTA
jgi:hypothetical protein